MPCASDRPACSGSVGVCSTPPFTARGCFLGRLGRPGRSAGNSQPLVVRRPRGLQGERYDARSMAGHAVSVSIVLDPRRGRAERDGGMTEEVEWFGGGSIGRAASQRFIEGGRRNGARTGSRGPQHRFVSEESAWRRESAAPSRDVTWSTRCWR